MKALDYKKRSTRIKAKTTLANQTQRTLRSLIITLTVMIAVLSISFLAITSQSAQQGYSLEQEKQKNEYLQTINTNLHTKITESTAFSELQKDKRVSIMEIVREKTYVTIEDNSVN